MLRFSTILILFVLLFTSAQAVNVEEMRILNIPVMLVNTVNEEIPTCDFAEAPEGCDGITSINSTKVPARMLMVQKNDTLYDSGEYKEDVSGLTIRIRGNTSAYFRPMKPYKLKLQKKADLFFRGDSRHKDKEWVLLNYYFYTPILATRIMDMLDFGWHPKYEFVNLFINEDYQGLYLLSESIKRDSDCRVDVSKNEGFLIENDPYWWSEPVYADATVIPNRYKFSIKYPDSDKISSEQVDSISSVMNRVELSIMNGTYPDEIDVRSFANWLILHDIIGTHDAGGSNMFISRYDNKSKIKMESPWDFDSSFKLDYKSDWASIHNSGIFYFGILLNNKNPYFLNLYTDIWNEKKNEIFFDMIDVLDSLKKSKVAADITLSRRYTLEKWYEPDDEKYQSYSVSDEILNYQRWFDERKTWLEENINTDFSIEDELTSSPSQE